ncbi:unnamed protein product [Brassica rapa]|uniref:Uncharacterized protein n=1 Tax=Brassica campestris TaxID=3711 RepID=A0A3P5Z4Q2_BRACM|nr:unnamed protein product [Brassica rapa]VDC70884.1 unnamed protein product [Brassica rapa]
MANLRVFLRIEAGRCSSNRVSRTSLSDGLDGLEEGHLKASSSYSHGTSERAMMNHWRVTGDIHEEVESYNRLLDKVVDW